MKNRGAWLAVAASLAAVIACGSSNNGNSSSGNGAGGFPYSGPSCSSSTINESCWGCLDSNCNGGCLTSACNDFFNCFCNCTQGSTSCYQGCASNISSSCQQCVSSISSCAQSSCSGACSTGGSSGVSPPGQGSGGSGGSGSSSGGMFQSCTGSTQVCGFANGASMEFCQSGFGNMCTSAYYQVGQQMFSCASCTDTTTCLEEAQAACGPSIIDAGPPPIDVGPVPDAPVFDGGVGTCHSVPCGTMGQSMQYCEVDDGEAGACTQAWYEVGSQIFDCTSCTQAGCQLAAQEASKACP